MTSHFLNALIRIFVLPPDLLQPFQTSLSSPVADLAFCISQYVSAQFKLHLLDQAHYRATVFLLVGDCLSNTLSVFW